MNGMRFVTGEVGSYVGGLPVVESMALYHGEVYVMGGRLHIHRTGDIDWWLWLAQQRKESAAHIDALCREAR